MAASQPRGYTLAIASADLDPALTLDEWSGMQLGVIDEQSSCHGAPDVSQIDVDGEPAVLAVYDRTDCDDDHHVLAVNLVRGERGYVLQWVAPTGSDDARRADFDDVLASLDIEP